MELDNVQNEIVVETVMDSHGFYNPYLMDTKSLENQRLGRFYKDMRDIRTDINPICWGFESLVKTEHVEDPDTSRDQKYEEKKMTILDWNDSSWNTLYKTKDKNVHPLFTKPPKYVNNTKKPEGEEEDDTKPIIRQLDPVVVASETPFDCGVCGKRFKEANLLKNHVRVHFVEKKFTCDVCQKRFAISNHLKNHYKVHTGEKNFECSECSKAFRQKGHLLNHLRMHLGVKKFSCPLCQKCFTQNVHMKSHLKTHTGEKNYSCKICFKQFTQSGHLQIHMTVHTGERRYECNQCGRRFKQSGHLSSHLKIHAKAVHQNL